MTRRTRNDDGAVLIIAIVIVSVVALITGVILSKGNGNLIATVSLRQVAASANASDAAAKIAINNLQLGSNAADPGATYPNKPWVFDNNADGSGCFGTNGDNSPRTSITLPNVSPKAGSISTPTSATVVCTPVTGTGLFGSGVGVPITSSNTFPRALTALTSGNDNGISIGSSGSSGFDSGDHGDEGDGDGGGSDVLVHGGVATNADITVDHDSSLFTNSYAWAKSCSGTILSTPAVDCHHASVSNPGYSADTGTVPTYQSVPTNCSHGVMTFQPGYYDDASALSSATDGSCQAVFLPGTYYFDFHNNTNDPTYNPDALGLTGDSGHCGSDGHDSGGCSSQDGDSDDCGSGDFTDGGEPFGDGGGDQRACGTDVWTVNGTLIGGTTTGSSMPGACVSPLTSSSANGVQFIFGGDSRVQLGRSAKVELCGTSHSGAPPIAVYGLTSGVSAPLSSPPAITAGNVSTSGSSPGFTLLTATPGRLANLESPSVTCCAIWTNAFGNGTGNLTLSNFSPGTAIPAGSMVKSATLQITHQETGPNATKLAVQATTSSDNGPTNTLPIRSSMTTDTVDVTTTLSQAVHDGNLGSAQVQLTEAVRGSATLKIDAVQLVLTYYPPALRGETNSAIPGNCLLSSCNFLTTPGGESFSGAFFVQGATYVPNGDFSLSLGGGQKTGVAFADGLMGSSVDLNQQSDYPGGVPFVSIPDQGPGFGSNVTAVDLKVYLCPGQATCSAAAGTLSLTSRVNITDPPGAAPAPGSRAINVLSWSEQR